jgi:hypothetical protein
MPSAFNDHFDETMITQRNRIFDLLPRYGWEVKNVEDHLRYSTAPAIGASSGTTAG